MTNPIYAARDFHLRGTTAGTGDSGAGTVGVDESVRQFIQGLTGQIFFSTTNTPAPGLLYAGRQYSWQDHPRLQMMFEANGHAFIDVDSFDNPDTFGIVDHEDFIRAGGTNIGQHVDDTTAANGLTGETVDRYAGGFTGRGTGGNVARSGRTDQTRVITLEGDTETAPDHRAAFFGIYGDMGFVTPVSEGPPIDGGPRGETLG